MFARSWSGARAVTLTLVGLLTATTLAPLPTLADDSLTPGTVATNAAGESILVRATPGYDGAGTGEVAAGSQVTVADYPVPAADGSLWYPVAGGFVPASAMANGSTAAAPEVTNQVSGYYDQNGTWIEETAVDTAGQAAPVAATGYTDENGVWVDTTGQAAPVESTGYYDQNGAWVDTTSQAAPVAATGYTDEYGNWVDTTGQAAPVVAESTGYTDEYGNWVDTTGQVAPAAQASGYYDQQSGVWVDTAYVEPATQPAAASQTSGYYDQQNGAWVDTSGQSATGTLVYNDASGQSNLVNTPASAPIGTAYISGTNGDGAICRAGADWATAELGVVPEGSAVEVTGGTVGEWQPVNCNGVSGYVHASFVAWEQPAAASTVNAAGADTTVVEAPRRNRNNRRGNNNNNANVNPGGSGQAIANYAMQYQGYPYVYAGEGPNAFDCSGFTKWVILNTVGIDITHDMFAQYDMGTKVNQNNLQPGDLVFFQNTFRPGMSHNGIYIGNNQFIHAENESTGVKISDITSEYYASRWYGAVRFTQ